MRRARRILFNAVTALSLILFLATMVLWVRSYFVSDEVYWHGFEDEGNRSYWTWNSLDSGRGGIGYTWMTQSSDATGRFGPMRRSEFLTRAVTQPSHRRSAPQYPTFNQISKQPVFWGFNYGSIRHPDTDPAKQRPGVSARHVVVPFWAIALTFGMTSWFLVTRLVRSARHQRRKRSGLCAACGYDLRATPDRCPECGRTTSPSPAGEN
jgi:hypothetical protein